MNSVSNCGCYCNEENIASGHTTVTFLQSYEKYTVLKHLICLLYIIHDSVVRLLNSLVCGLQDSDSYDDAGCCLTCVPKSKLSSPEPSCTNTKPEFE